VLAARGPVSCGGDKKTPDFLGSGPKLHVTSVGSSPSLGAVGHGLKLPAGCLRYGAVYVSGCMSVLTTTPGA